MVSLLCHPNKPYMENFIRVISSDFYCPACEPSLIVVEITDTIEKAIVELKRKLPQC